MIENTNRELEFQEIVSDLVYSFGAGSQEGIKASLKECQEIFSFVSVNHQAYIANGFQVDMKIIKTMIKFMPSIKESAIEYDVICCSGRRCADNGSVEVLKAVKESLGMDFNETSRDGRIRLRTQNCFKKCSLGPNIMVNGDFHHKMDRAKTIELMEKIK